LIAELRRLIAVKLDEVYLHTLEYTADLVGQFVHKQRHHRNKGRHNLDNTLSLFNSDRPGAFRVKHQANGIRATGDRHTRFFRPGDTANFDTRLGHGIELPPKNKGRMIADRPYRCLYDASFKQAD
jgi:hypothetical protein